VAFLTSGSDGFLAGFFGAVGASACFFVPSLKRPLIVSSPGVSGFFGASSVVSVCFSFPLLLALSFFGAFSEVFSTGSLKVCAFSFAGASCPLSCGLSLFSLVCSGNQPGFGLILILPASVCWVVLVFDALDALAFKAFASPPSAITQLISSITKHEVAYFCMSRRVVVKRLLSLLSLALALCTLYPDLPPSIL